MNLLLVLILVVCVIAWFKRYIVSMMLLYYIKEQYKLPSEAEVEIYTALVVDNFFKDLMSRQLWK